MISMNLNFNFQDPLKQYYPFFHIILLQIKNLIQLNYEEYKINVPHLQ